MDAVFKALADKSRRKLLDALVIQDGQTLAALCARADKRGDLTRQAISKHLAILEAANLITIEWQGREKLHYLNPVPIRELVDRWIRKYEQPRMRALSDLKHRLEAETDKRQPSPQASRSHG